MGTLFFASILALIVGSYPRAFFFLRFISSKMTRPKEKDLSRINHILETKHLPKQLISFFMFILFLKVRWYLHRRRNSKKFISAVNVLIENIHRYSLEKVTVDKKLGIVLERYDKTLFYQLNNYASHKPWPIIRLFRSIISLNKENSFDFHLTLSAGEDTALRVFGSPIVNPALGEYRVSNEVISEFGSVFDSKKDFMKNLCSIAV